MLEDCFSAPPALLLDIEKNLEHKTRLRYRRITNSHRKTQFLLSRYLIAQAMKHETGEICYPSSIDGKPPFFTHSNYFCSVSYSKHLIAIAISNSALGIDIESHKPRDFSRIVTEYFHPEEQIEFRTLRNEDHAHWFYNKWTQKEALGKLNGTGIAQTLCLNISETQPLKSYTSGQKKTPGYTISIASTSSAKVNLFTAPLKQNENPDWINQQYQDSPLPF